MIRRLINNVFGEGLKVMGLLGEKKKKVQHSKFKTSTSVVERCITVLLWNLRNVAKEHRETIRTAAAWCQIPPRLSPRQFNNTSDTSHPLHKYSVWYTEYFIRNCTVPLKTPLSSVCMMRCYVTQLICSGWCDSMRPDSFTVVPVMKFAGSRKNIPPQMGEENL